MSIEVKDLKVAYDETIVIPKMNLQIPKRKLSMIIGGNGCGKSTLLKSIGRIIKPNQGAISIDGAVLKKMAPKEIARKMALLPQNPIAPKGLTVKELVGYGRYPYQKAMGGMSSHDTEVIQWAMKETGVYEFREKEVDTLSGGQRQRAWIAMALAQETDILILDEPTTYLDLAHQLEVLKLLKALNEKNGTTIIIVIHELNLASKFADCLIGMKEGRLIFQGEPKEVVTAENLKILYEIDAKIQLSQDGQYPICSDYELVKPYGKK